MSSSNANKENEGPTAAVAAPNKNLVIYSTDMTPEMRSNVIQIATKAFASPVTSGKVYQSIADKIKTECEKEVCGDGGGWSCVVGDAFGSSHEDVHSFLNCAECNCTFMASIGWLNLVRGMIAVLSVF